MGIIERNSMSLLGEGRSGSSAAAKAEQIRTLYRQNVGIVTVNPLNAAIVAAVLWRSINRAELTGWVAATIIVAIGRIILRNRYLRVFQPEEETNVWARRFVIGAMASGVLWGLA